MNLNLGKSSWPVLFALLLSSQGGLAAVTCQEAFGDRPQIADVGPGLDQLPPQDQKQFLLLTSDPGGFSEKLIDNSYLKPVVAGTVAIFHGDIFVEGYFRNQRGQNPGKNPPSTQTLSQTQPWLHWNPQTHAYVAEHAGTAVSLLASFVKDGKVTLYRGLRSEAEAAAYRKIAKGNSVGVAEALFEGNRDAVFFTTDKAAAIQWSTGSVLELTIDEAATHNFYVGIETTYVEVGIFDPKVLTQWASQMKVVAKK
jgi:hypothetical protein